MIGRRFAGWSYWEGQVPSDVAPGSTARVHVTFVPNRALKAHWNNESEPLRLWIDPPSGCQVESQLLTGNTADQPQSDEVRRLDVELQVPDDADYAIRVPAYGLYYVCEDIDGACQYLRQDVPIEIRISGRQTR